MLSLPHLLDRADIDGISGVGLGEDTCAAETDDAADAGCAHSLKPIGRDAERVKNNPGFHSRELRVPVSEIKLVPDGVPPVIEPGLQPTGDQVNGPAALNQGWSQPRSGLAGAAEKDTRFLVWHSENLDSVRLGAGLDDIAQQS
jgi:hypothetical protein